MCGQQDALSGECLRWRQALEGSGLGVWDWWPQRQQVYFSPQWKTMLGYAPHELADEVSVWHELLHPDEREAVLAQMRAFLAPGGEDQFMLEFRLRCADGSYRWVASRGQVMQRDAAGWGERLLGTHADIHAMRQAHEQVHFLSYHDALTRLPNRQMLLDMASRMLERAGRIGDPVAIGVLDIDQFKVMNDALGAGQGDALLQQVADRLAATLRGSDLVARLAADSFGLLLPGMDEQGVRSFVLRLQQLLAHPLVLPGHDQPFSIRFSMGIAFYPEDGQDVETLLHHAEEAMYEAKRQGGDQLVVFNAEIHERLQRRILLESGLRVAMQRGELAVCLQPQVMLADGALIGFEALMRWEHPEDGAVSPAEFIPAAEGCGLIVPLGYWILESVVALLARWQASGQPMAPIAVNLSPVQFRQRDLAERIGRMLSEHGVDGCWLHLEVTESMLMHDEALAARTMRQLRAQGVCWALDDFGTGCSNIAYLQVQEFDVLKIDRRFVVGLAQSVEKKALVRGMIEMAHAMGLKTLAEGPDAADLPVLRALGCDMVQGFVLGMPVPVEEASTRYLKDVRPWQCALAGSA